MNNVNIVTSTKSHANVYKGKGCYYYLGKGQERSVQMQ